VRDSVVPSCSSGRPDPADGTPLVFASRLRVRLPERVATTDLFHDVAERAPSVAATFYLLGATDAVIARAAENVRRKYPRLTSRDTAAAIPPPPRRASRGAVNAARPDILGGMGASAEQRFCLRVRAGLQCRADQDLRRAVRFCPGRNSRAPGWMRWAGMGVPQRSSAPARHRYLTTARRLLLTSRNPR
jgi:UDP-N-acetyl-D-mannosaminuronic acid transferase (WecB/TagA/CpsF family)